MSIKYNGKLIAGKYKVQFITDATETNKGLIRLATQDEINAGTDDTTAITPKNLATKQDIISDLDTIRVGATAGSTALQSGDNISALNNDSGYLTNDTLPIGSNMQEGIVQVDGTSITAEDGVISAVQQDLTPYLTKDSAMATYETIENAMSVQEELQNSINTKQDIISDLDTIRNGSILGATALQEETDPVYTTDKPNIAQTDLSNLTEEGIQVIKENSNAGLPLLFIGQSLYIDESLGLDRYLNGQIVAITENYKPALEALQSLAATNPSLFDTEENWQAAKTLSAFGQVGKFVFNYAEDGETVVSIRLPRVVNVQGLFDLQNLGLTVAESLPNITGTTRQIFGGIDYVSGALSASVIQGNVMPRGSEKAQLFTLDINASRSSSTYQDGAHVQQEAVQYPYFIRLATGVENEVNITNKFENTNPHTLLESKYSDKPLYNESQLLSNGQWNTKGMYPTIYEVLQVEYNSEIEAGTTVTLPSGISYTKRGLPVKLSTEEYDDYDFVLNTTDETFRLALLDGSENLVGNAENRIPLTLGASGDTYQQNKNGYYVLAVSSNVSYWYLENLTSYVVSGVTNAGAGYSNRLFVPARRGDIIRVSYQLTPDAYDFYFIPSVGNGSLYYYVGDIDKNHGIVDMGRIGESFAGLVEVGGSISMPSDKYIDLTVGASGSTYIAPSNGWFAARVPFTTNQACTLFNANTCLGSQCTANGSWTSYTSIPASKGDVITLFYNCAPNLLRFIYAEGSKWEAYQ